jgi:hypothetical protein
VFEEVTARRAASAGIAALRRKRRHGQPRLHRRAEAVRAAADRRTAAGAEGEAPGGDRTLSHFLRTTGPHLLPRVRRNAVHRVALTGRGRMANIIPVPARTVCTSISTRRSGCTPGSVAPGTAAARRKGR